MTDKLVSQVRNTFLSPCGDGKERKDSPSQSSLLDNNVIDAQPESAGRSLNLNLLTGLLPH